MRFFQYKANRMAELLAEPWGADRIPGLVDLIGFTAPRSVLEIGAYVGVSTEVFLLNCGKVLTIDPWDGMGEGAEPQYREFMLRCGHYPHLTYIKDYSAAALPTLTDHRFDLIYIDGNHTYDHVMQDIRLSVPLLANYGWLAGHDYGGPGTPDVARAVTLISGGQNVTIFADSSWLIRKSAINPGYLT